MMQVHHVLDLSLVSHCHGMDFLELGDLEVLDVEGLELVEDLYHRGSSPKSVDLRGGLSGAFLLAMMRKVGIARSCYKVLPFV